MAADQSMIEKYFALVQEFEREIIGYIDQGKIASVRLSVCPDHQGRRVLSVELAPSEFKVADWITNSNKLDPRQRY